jgi:hypothetical protein
MYIKLIKIEILKQNPSRIALRTYTSIILEHKLLQCYIELTTDYSKQLTRKVSHEINQIMVCFGSR